MANIPVNVARHEVDELMFSQRLTEEAADELSGLDASEEPGIVADSEASDVGTACYMCHACTNFGVHGKEVRPCARGLSDLIKRRHKARHKVRMDRGKVV